MDKYPLKVIYEDNHLLLVNKPAALPTMGVSAETASLLAAAKKYIKKKYNKPGNVYLGIVSRLDSPVTGVVVIARTSKAAARLTEQFRDRTVTKQYRAVVSGRLEQESGECVDYLLKHDRHRKVVLVSENHPRSQKAHLRYEVCGYPTPNTTQLKIELLTGRKHQIRIQMQTLGHPIIGDRKYGSQAEFPSGIALHAHKIEFQHPVKDERVEFMAPVPNSWKQVFGIDSFE